MSRRRKWNEDDLIIAVSKCRSITEVLRSIGLRDAGGNFKTIKKAIKEFNLDTSHFETSEDRCKKLHAIRKKDIFYYLREDNYTTSSSSLKERLFKEGLKKRECEDCGQGEEWRGKKMSLILDHKNGIHSDYRLENLKIYCPNCNSTLPTHCGKNKSSKKCSDCGADIKHKGNYCRGCYLKNHNKLIGKGNKGKNMSKRKVEQRPSYDELKFKIEKHGYCAVGRMYGVSDNAIRKWMKKYESLKN